MYTSLFSPNHDTQTERKNYKVNASAHEQDQVEKRKTYKANASAHEQGLC